MYPNDDVWRKMEGKVDESIAFFGNIPKGDSDDLKRQKIELIKSFYFKDGAISRDNIRNLTDVSECM